MSLVRRETELTARSGAQATDEVRRPAAQSREQYLRLETEAFPVENFADLCLQLGELQSGIVNHCLQALRLDIANIGERTGLQLILEARTEKLGRRSRKLLCHPQDEVLTFALLIGPQGSRQIGAEELENQIAAQSRRGLIDLISGGDTERGHDRASFHLGLESFPSGLGNLAPVVPHRTAQRVQFNALDRRRNTFREFTGHGMADLLPVPNQSINALLGRLVGCGRPRPSRRAQDQYKEEQDNCGRIEAVGLKHRGTPQVYSEDRTS
ncbi:MAG TPA: hypothetical protein DCG06_14580 [Deltaproteobacteria bacterium]|nr:hypothetical protein [Deltaproteobacteria bacterium]